MPDCCTEFCNTILLYTCFINIQNPFLFKRYEKLVLTKVKMAVGIKETNCDIATHVMKCRHYVTKYCLLNRKVYNHVTIACDEKDDSQRQYLVLIIF